MAKSIWNIVHHTAFSIYIKSLGDKAVYRVEESVMMQSPLVDVLHTIRNPSEQQNKEK